MQTNSERVYSKSADHTRKVRKGQPTMKDCMYFSQRFLSRTRTATGRHFSLVKTSTGATRATVYIATAFVTKLQYLCEELN